ncbi:MAG: hypothetical protein GY926_22130 [bacterium]|nr:hypothetical protein [bacterium]
MNLFLVPVLLVAGLVYVYGPWGHDSKEQAVPHDTKSVEPGLIQQLTPAGPVSESVP